MQHVLAQGSNGGIKKPKPKIGQKTKDDYNLRPPKEKDHKRSQSVIHKVGPNDQTYQNQTITVQEPQDDYIQLQHEKYQIMDARRKAINGTIYNLENQARSQNRIADSLYRERDPAFTDTYNPNAVINEPANDLASRAIPWHLLFAQNQMLSGNSSKGVPQIGYETDMQQGTSTQDPDVQQTDQDAGGNETKKDTNNLEYKTGATDWGQPAINTAYINNPYPRKNTGYYMDVGGIPSLMQKKEIYDKSSKINKPKERKNYINPSQLKKSVAAQETLKKYGKNKKKK
ncbi:MAG: hypothetical protein EZS28_007958 [Streblomastix strix]|uniref:Uncharacterized protein n=1 Tax=Streblomastix strix TaxID=222440 RepID=A0A5J4WP35_9EUKA|nr:MAG: hypothetical protein EZS28_007958 [Streblomastix strix]